MVGGLLTLVTFAVIQLGLGVYVRGLAHDAAIEGAYYAALADVADDAGAAHAVDIIERTAGAGFAQSAETRRDDSRGYPAIEVSVHVALPLLGFTGVPGAWEVTAHAPIDDVDR